MTKREFLDTVFALAPNEANAIMDAFDEYVDSNEPHWIPVTERLPEDERNVLITYYDEITMGWYRESEDTWLIYEGDANAEPEEVTAWCELPEPYKGVTT